MYVEFGSSRPLLVWLFALARRGSLRGSCCWSSFIGENACVCVCPLKDNKLVMSFTCCYSSASISAFNRILGYPLFAMRSWSKKDHDNTKDGHKPIRFVLL